MIHFDLCKNVLNLPAFLSYEIPPAGLLEAIEIQFVPFLHVDARNSIIMDIAIKDQASRMIYPDRILKRWRECI